MARARFGSGDFMRVLAASAQPVYLLDSRRMLVYANASCASWLGVEIDRLLGARCDYHSLEVASEPQTLAAGLCPPPEAFSAPHYRGVVTALHNDQLEERTAEFIALTLPEEAAPALLCIVAASTRETPLTTTASTPAEPSSAELHVLLRWVRQTLNARPALDRWLGDDPRVRHVRDQFHAAASSHGRVVVVGPRGAGREELARGIYYRHRSEATAPLVRIDCPAVDAESLQTAITSLLRYRPSVTGESAAMLLSDVDRLAAAAQRELLGFLELPGFEVRTLATAETSLLALATRGAFDRSLAFALSTMVIELPKLSERLGDLPLLVQGLVEELNAAGGKQCGGLTQDALERLAVYSWPGDVAQLAETIRQAWTAAAGPQITLMDLPRWLTAAEDAAAHPARPTETIVLDEFLADVERELLRRALARGRGNKAKAARLLGISRPRLLRRMEQLGILDAKPET